MLQPSDQPAARALSRSSEREDRGDQLVAAAYELLDEAGLEGLTIRAVLARTGLARRAFYDRFATKDDLVLAVFGQTLHRAAGHFAGEVHHLTDPLARLEAIVGGIVLGQASGGSIAGRRSAALSREHLRLAEARPADLQAAIAPLIELITRELASGMDQGRVRRAPPERLAMLVYNLVSTTVHTELLAEEGAPPNRRRREQLAAEIWEFCRRAIAA
jgi:AcrR family transcriptional regulator